MSHHEMRKTAFSILLNSSSKILTKTTRTRNKERRPGWRCIDVTESITIQRHVLPCGALPRVSLNPNPIRIRPRAHLTFLDCAISIVQVQRASYRPHRERTNNNRKEDRERSKASGTWSPYDPAIHEAHGREKRCKSPSCPINPTPDIAVLGYVRLHIRARILFRCYHHRSWDPVSEERGKKGTKRKRRGNREACRNRTRRQPDNQPLDELMDTLYKSIRFFPGDENLNDVWGWFRGCYWVKRFW